MFSIYWVKSYNLYNKDSFFEFFWKMIHWIKDLKLLTIFTFEILNFQKPQDWFSNPLFSHKT